ncbi:cell division protein FtsA, partial [Candidatus Beckwithbacteria bacterium]|nr:cell division protein FtsA [Candidatus Beckwithbacteria bacterium]
EAVIESITRSVEAAERMAGFSITDAYVSINGSSIQSQNSKGVVAIANSGEEITQDDVERVLEAARAVSLPTSREILHVIPRDYLVDSQGGIKDPLGMTGVRLEADAHIITGASIVIRNLTKCVSDIGIRVNGLVFAGLAATYATLTDTEKELGVCLVDIGEGSTAVCVYVENALTSSFVIPIGAKHITNDLAIGLRISLEQAEKLKLALSNHSKEQLLKDAKESEDLLDLAKLGIFEEIKKPSYKMMVEGIIKPRLNEIFGMIADELKRQNLMVSTPAGVVLSGGGALTVEIQRACKTVLAMPVRVAKLDSTEQKSYELTGLIDDIGSPIFAVAQGLIFYAKEQEGTSSSQSIPQFSGLIEKFSGKSFASKAIEFIKSFLP